MSRAEQILTTLVQQNIPVQEQADLTAKARAYLTLLQSRGLADERVAAQLAFDYIKAGNSQRKLPAELYDKVNYLCRCYMDRVARFYLCYDFVPDVTALQTAIICLYEKAPIFHSLFTDDHIRPYWKVTDYHIDDVFSVIAADDLPAAAVAFLEQSVSMDDPSQMKIALVHNGTHSILAFRWNHMIMDGGGFKQFTADLCNAYNQYRKTGDAPLDFRTGSRKYTKVYDDMPASLRKKAKAQFAGVTVKEKRKLPFTPVDGSECNSIVYHSVEKDVMQAAIAVAKQNGATVNDLLCAAYIWACYAVMGEAQKPLHLSCAVDLRRYIRQPETLGYTNHTTFMYCSVPHLPESDIQLLQYVHESNDKNKQDPFLGLHGIPLLNIGYATMVQLQAEAVVKLFYNNADIALSNVGAVDVKGFALDGHPVTDALVAGGAKVKPCAAATVLTCNGKLTISVCTQGNQQDRDMLHSFFGFFEQFLRSIAPN